jgi:hypothetical protein
VNASQWSARYAERKRAAQRARDAASAPRTCNRCATLSVSGSIFCQAHADEYEALTKSGLPVDQILKFTERTHWPKLSQHCGVTGLHTQCPREITLGTSACECGCHMRAKAKGER